MAYIEATSRFPKTLFISIKNICHCDWCGLSLDLKEVCITIVFFLQLPPWGGGGSKVLGRLKGSHIVSKMAQAGCLWDPRHWSDRLGRRRKREIGDSFELNWILLSYLKLSGPDGGCCWRRIWVKMGRFCGILGPWCWKFGLKCLSFGAGAVQKRPKMKCSGAWSLKFWNVCKAYYLLHFSHLGGRMGQVFGRPVGLSRRVFWEASKKFGVEYECRRSLTVYLGSHGGPLGGLRVNLDAFMGHCMAQVLLFLFFFEVRGESLKAFWDVDRTTLALTSAIS